MSKRNLSTEEILALVRKQDSGGDAGATGASESDADETAQPEPAQPEAAEAASEEPPADEKPAASKPPAKTPGSTADILAAARAQAAGGGSKPTEKPAKAAEKTEDQPAETAASSKPAPRPKSTADILAAARGQGKSGAKPAPAAEKKESPTAKSPASRPAAAKSPPEGERPSVQEMLKAVRSEKPTDKPGESAAAKPKLPAKPKTPVPPQAEPVPRRSVLRALVITPFALAWIAFAGACGAALLGVARFALPNILIEPPTKFKIGLPEDYPLGTVSTKWKSEFAVWITHTMYNGQPMIYALSTVCTHLGCTPNWLQGEQKFKCPCHGSGFYPTGINFEGPAPRPLERYAIRVAPDGMLEVDKSSKYQQEMGQWADPASFVPTA